MKITNQKVQVVTISSAMAGQRIDNFLFTYLKGVPKSMVYRILRKGEVRINKRRIKAHYKLLSEDMIRIPPVRLGIQSEVPISPKLHKVTALNNHILYEDDHLLIINKPSGTAVHGGSGLRFGVIEGLRAMRSKTCFLELVHRLDRDTSGVLLIAKKRSALRLLHEQLRMKEMRKDYLALVKGHWHLQCKTVRAPLMKNTLNRSKRIVFVGDKGKPSETRFKIEARYELATLVKATPITGRTHQIRAHALHAGHPIAGDNRYGDREFDAQLLSTNLNRLFLHAISIRFEHPSTRTTMCITAPMDKSLRYCLDRLGDRLGVY